MIKAKNLTRRFEQIVAVDHINATIKGGSVFGPVGTNGAGKGTFLRMANGVLKPDKDSITIDGEPMFENTRVGSRSSYTSDDQSFFNNATPDEMMFSYMTAYPKFNKMRYIRLMGSFDSERKRKTSTLSKDMKKQMSVICDVCAETNYLFYDETFGGLDPVIRQTVKSIFVGNMQEQSLAPIIASRDLWELEDIYDHVELLHRDGILLSKDLDDMRLNIHKIQCVLRPGMKPEDLVAPDRAKIGQRRSLCTLAVRGTRRRVEALTTGYRPVLAEIIPLSPEEIFISKTEMAGYDIERPVL